MILNEWEMLEATVAVVTSAGECDCYSHEHISNCTAQICALIHFLLNIQYANLIKMNAYIKYIKK